MDYSFFSSIPPLQCIQGVPYIALQKGNGGSNPRIFKAFQGQESGSSDSYEEKCKNVWTYAHIPMYMGLRSKVMCTREYGFKSHVQQ